MGTVPLAGQPTGSAIAVEPERCFLGGTIRVHGFVKPASASPAPVTLRFTPPVSGDAITRSVPVEADGDYEHLFAETLETGTWKVEASHRGRSAGTATFEVGRTLFLAPLAEELDDEVRERSEAAVRELRGALESYPPFPGKERLESDLETLLQDFRRLAAVLDHFRTLARDLDQAVSAHADELPETTLKPLRRAAAAADRTRGGLGVQMVAIDQVLESTRQETEWCAYWQGWADELDLLGRAYNFLVTGLEDVLLNSGLAAASDWMPSPINTLVTSTVALVAAATSGSAIALATAVAATVTAASSLILQAVVGERCARYEDKEVEGRYRLEVLHRGKPFFTTTHTLAGTLRLLFQRRKPGDPAVYLKGDFKGRVKDLGCDLDMRAFDLPHAAVLDWCRNPITPVTPGQRSFDLRLDGKALDHRLEVRLDRVVTDFDLQAAGYYVVLSADAPVPLPGDIVFPLMDAEWCLTRVTRLSMGEEHFVLEFHTVGGPAGNRLVARGAFDRTIELPPTPQRKGVRVSMSVAFELEPQGPAPP